MFSAYMAKNKYLSIYTSSDVFHQISVKQGRSEKFYKESHNFHIFFNRLFIRQNYCEVDLKKEKF